MKIIDLFCGLGGVARGFQRYLEENGIDYEYVAVDIDQKILLAHKILNPRSRTVKRDAWSFSDEELKKFDFIWASPPCETHSKLMLYHRGTEKFRPPDTRLWELISRLYELGVPFCVENVRPYYGFPIRPTARVGRHYVWSNLSLRDVDWQGEKFENVKDDARSLMRYHDIPESVKKVLRGRKLRDALRDMMNPQLAYKLAEQIFPQISNGRIRTVQVTLSAFDCLQFTEVRVCR